LRATGWTPARIFGLAAQLSGLQADATPRPLASLADLFD